MTNLKLALRGLCKSPFVTSVAVLSLALGIGANAAIFSLFNQILLRPLPVADPARLVNLASPGPRQGSNSCNNAGGCDETFSYAMFRDLERAYATTHLDRLSDRTTLSIETSSLHIDLISDLKRINSHICSIAYPILESAGALAPSRLRESRLGKIEG